MANEAEEILQDGGMNMEKFMGSTTNIQKTFREMWEECHRDKKKRYFRANDMIVTIEGR